MDVGYVGLGSLGGALAGRFLAGHKLHVWDLNPAATDAMAARGATPAAASAALGERCDVVLLCLPRSADVHDLLFGSGRLPDRCARGRW